MPSEHKICSACSKTGQGLKKCTACKTVWYCDVTCQKAHRKDHRKECKRLEKELKDTAANAAAADFEALSISDTSTRTSTDDEDLFQALPSQPDCPICMLPLPISGEMSTYMACCGKMICSGCIYENTRVIEEKNEKNSRRRRPLVEDCCPFCRTPPPTRDKELVSRVKKRADLNDPDATTNMGAFYMEGLYGLPKDESKAREFLDRAVDLGSANACFSLAMMHSDCPKRNAKNHREYLERAAKGGSARAHYHLGVIEYRSRKIKRAYKHYRLALAAGDEDSLNSIKEMYRRGQVSKEDFAASLRAFQSALLEVKSKERDIFAALLQSGTLIKKCGD